MAGTDKTRCSACGEDWYDRPDRVGTVCPLCWEIQQAEVKAAEAEQAADDLKAHLDQRRKDQKELQKAAKAAA